MTRTSGVLATALTWSIFVSLVAIVPAWGSDTLVTHRLSADLANRAVAAAVADCAARGIWNPR